MKQEITVAALKTQSLGIEGVKEKMQYYITIGEGEKKCIINVGEKTYNAVKALDTTKTKKDA